MSTIITEFEKTFEKFPIFSQDWIENPIVLAKLWFQDRIWLLTEYDTENKTAFGYYQDKNISDIGYSYIPDIDKDWLNYLLEAKFKPTYLNKLLEKKKMVEFSKLIKERQDFFNKT